MRFSIFVIFCKVKIKRKKIIFSRDKFIVINTNIV